jgi:hypothetical protein
VRISEAQQPLPAGERSVDLPNNLPDFVGILLNRSSPTEFPPMHRVVPQVRVHQVTFCFGKIPVSGHMQGISSSSFQRSDEQQNEGEKE